MELWLPPARLLENLKKVTTAFTTLTSICISYWCYLLTTGWVFSVNAHLLPHRSAGLKSGKPQLGSLLRDEQNQNQGFNCLWSCPWFWGESTSEIMQDIGETQFFATESLRPIPLGSLFLQNGNNAILVTLWISLEVSSRICPFVTGLFHCLKVYICLFGPDWLQRLFLVGLIENQAWETDG